jgi:hypothetical protein
MIDGEQPDTPVRRRYLPTRKQMNDPKQQAEQLFKEQKPTSTMTEYEREQEKIRANLERLRKERVARKTSFEKIFTSQNKFHQTQPATQSDSG